ELLSGTPYPIFPAIDSRPAAGLHRRMQRLVMTPAPGERLVRFVGDQLCFRLTRGDGRPLPEGWQARLRTNLGRGEALRREIIITHTGRPRLALAAWRDVPLARRADGTYELSFALTE